MPDTQDTQSASKTPRRVGRPSVQAGIRAGLDELIRSRGLQRGDRLDSEKLLCERFGVSRPSLRKALRSLARQGRIQSIPGKGHYVNSAEGGVTSVSGIILCVLGSYQPEVIWSNTHLAGIVHSLQAQFARAGHRLLIESLGSPGRAVETIITPHIKDLTGLVLVPLGDQRAEDMLAASPAKMPRVVIGRAVDHPTVPCICVDHEDVIRRAVGHLLQLGHRRIAMLSAGKGPPVEQRLEAYRQALGQAGLADSDLLQANVTQAPEAWRQALGELFDRHPDVTALIVNGVDVAQVADMLSRRGIGIPGDLSLIGVDDSEQARQYHPPLSVVRQPVGRLGELGGQMLLDLLAGQNPSPRSVTLASELSVRDSVAPPRLFTEAVP